MFTVSTSSFCSSVERGGCLLKSSDRIGFCRIDIESCFGITHVGSMRRIHVYLAREFGGHRLQSRREDGVGLDEDGFPVAATGAVLQRSKFVLRKGLEIATSTSTQVDEETFRLSPGCFAPVLVVDLTMTGRSQSSTQTRVRTNLPRQGQEDQADQAPGCSHDSCVENCPNHA